MDPLLPPSLFAGLPFLGAPRRFHLSWVFACFPLLLSLLSGSPRHQLLSRGDERGALLESVRVPLPGLPWNSIPARGSGAARTQGRAGGGLAALRDGTVLLGRPSERRWAPRPGPVSGCSRASACFPLRAGGVASEQQASRSAKTTRGLRGLPASTCYDRALLKLSRCLLLTRLREERWDEETLPIIFTSEPFS